MRRRPMAATATAAVVAGLSPPTAVSTTTALSSASEYLLSHNGCTSSGKGRSLKVRLLSQEPAESLPWGDPVSSTPGLVQPARFVCSCRVSRSRVRNSWQSCCLQSLNCGQEAPRASLKRAGRRQA
uniref:Putative secreted protein n=1 Tax=Ixodes ricinus TaxID=34613 RepID=A0A6B0UQC8_IXORI